VIKFIILVVGGYYLSDPLESGNTLCLERRGKRVLNREAGKVADRDFDKVRGIQTLVLQDKKTGVELYD